VKVKPSHGDKIHLSVIEKHEEVQTAKNDNKNIKTAFKKKLRGQRV
jgi:hypothetical protein